MSTTVLQAPVLKGGLQPLHLYAQPPGNNNGNPSNQNGIRTQAKPLDKKTNKIQTPATNPCNKQTCRTTRGEQTPVTKIKPDPWNKHKSKPLWVKKTWAVGKKKNESGTRTEPWRAPPACSAWPLACPPGHAKKQRCSTPADKTRKTYIYIMLYI